MATAGEEADGDDLVAVLFGAGKHSDLFPSGEELNVALGVGAEGEVIQPEFVVSDSDEGAFELDMVVADESNFGARKNHAAS